MLAKKYRFHSRGGVRYTYQKGKTIRTPKMSLVFNANSRGNQRFAVVISKKVIKSAVGRNRVRRRVYESIRSLLPEYTENNDCIFVIYSKDIKEIEFTKLQEIIKNLLEQSKK
jgi:ribonuclease P protein component